MNLFGWRKNLTISQEHPTFKVRYLGNVQTAVMKGEGCVDKATNVIWNNYMRSDHNGLEMKVELTGSGMKAYTKEQGITEYLAHRISYCIAHPDFPKLFVWVYRHEGRKMKMELRCHAVLCKNAAKAKTMALQLREKLSFALSDFKREKLHKQNSRLVLQRTNSFPKSGSVLPLRTQLLSTAKNFRPPTAKSQALLKLGAIQEDAAEEFEDEYLGEEEDEEECVEEVEDDEALVEKLRKLNCNRRNTDPNHSPVSAGPPINGLVHQGKEHHDILDALDLDSSDDLNGELFGAEPIIDLEFGNDLDELRRDNGVRAYCMNEAMDSDEESAESGFHDQDAALQDAELNDSAAPRGPKTSELNGFKSGGVGGVVVGAGERSIDGEDCDQTVCPWPMSDEEADNENDDFKHGSTTMSMSNSLSSSSARSSTCNHINHMSMKTAL